VKPASERLKLCSSALADT